MRKIEDLEELKSIELSIMKKIHTFCTERDISYYLAYGTLIGAIRHSGFIPWDDDIDIQMFREDYERFIVEFTKVQEQYGCQIVNSKTKPYFGRNMSKVIDTNTVVIEKKYNKDDNIGVFVDIWPLDGTPNNKLHRKIIICLAKLISKMQLAASTDYKQEETKKRKLAVIICNLFSSKRLLFVLDKISKKYKIADSEMLFVYCGKENEIAKRNYSKPILHDFEDVQLYIPSGYNEILTTYYGDYMKPPKDKKTNHIMNAYFK